MMPYAHRTPFAFCGWFCCWIAGYAIIINGYNSAVQTTQTPHVSDAPILHVRVWEVEW